MDRDIVRTVAPVTPDVAHEAWTTLVAAVHIRRRAIIVMAKALKVLRDGGWKVLGYGSFRELLAQPEVGLREKSARQYISLYETLVERYRIPEERLVGIPVDRLQAIKALPEEKAVALVDAARELGHIDFRKELAEAKGAGCEDIETRCRWLKEDGTCGKMTKTMS